MVVVVVVVFYITLHLTCTGVRRELFSSDAGPALVAHGHLRRRSLLGLGAEGAARPALRHLLDHQRHVGGLRGNRRRLLLVSVEKGKGSPYSITEHRVPELIPVLGSQPAGDVSHKPDGRLPLLSARPAVTPATLKRAATSFAAW